MKLPRNIDGHDLAAHLVRNWGYAYVRQTGSHVRLRAQEPFPHSVTIPMHNPLKPGTFLGIVKDVSLHKNVDPGILLEDL